MNVEEYLRISPRDSVAENAFAKWLNQLLDEAKKEVLLTILAKSWYDGERLTQRCITNPDHLAEILRYVIETFDISSMRSFFRSLVPKMSPSRVLSIVQEYRVSSLEAYRKAVYSLRPFFPSSDAALDAIFEEMRCDGT
jgi:hypothetical protein